MYQMPQRIGMTRSIRYAFFGLLLLLLLAAWGLSGSGIWSAAASNDFNVSRSPIGVTGAIDGAPACPLNWQIVSSPNGGAQDSELMSVAAATSNHAWAVGFYGSGQYGQTQIFQWNGSSWSIASSPNLGTGSNLNSVAAVSSTDVWAVGCYANGSGSVCHTLVEHWNGQYWAVVPSPSPGSAANDLTGLAVVSSTDVWAVGYYRNSSGVNRTLTEHWNGATWSVASSPNQGTSDNQLNSVAAAGSNHVWAVGYYTNGSTIQAQVFQWNGSSWAIAPSPSRGIDSTLNSVAAVSSTDVWVVGYYDTGIGSVWHTLIEHFGGNTWNVVSSPDPGSNSNELFSVAAVSSTNVWAVGYSYSSGSPAQTLVERWNGAAWSVMSSPNTGTGDNVLHSVTTVSSTDAWAVGYQGDDLPARQTLIERYVPCPPTATPTPTNTPVPPTNTPTSTPTPLPCSPNWQVAPSPNQGTGDNVLNSVAAVSPSDAWAVGYYSKGTSRYTLVERWNGIWWSTVPSPSPGTSDNRLNAIAVVSSTDVWVAGYYYNGTYPYQTLIEHWNGATWSVVPSPNPSATDNRLYSLAAVSSTNVWAVGNYSNGTYEQTLIEKWDGTAWSVVPGANPSNVDAYLNSVTALSSTDAWAVGYQNGSAPQALIEHWDGTSWSIVSSPNPGNNGLYSVAAVSSTDVWAAGQYYNGSLDQTLIEHWDGTSWSVVPSPSPGTYDNVLLSLAATSSTDIWAVGAYSNGSSYQTLVERWDGTAWSVLFSPNPGIYDNYLASVAVEAPSDAWAVGNYSNGSADRTLAERYNPCP